MNRPKTVAERIRHLHALGHTQEVIASAVGLSQPTVCRYIAGTRLEARESTVLRVAEGYRLLTRTAPARKRKAAA